MNFFAFICCAFLAYTANALHCPTCMDQCGVTPFSYPSYQYRGGGQCKHDELWQTKHELASLLKTIQEQQVLIQELQSLVDGNDINFILIMMFYCINYVFRSP